MTDNIITTLKDLVHWIATGPGAVGIATWFVAWVLEEFAFWKKLAPKVKSISVFGFAAALGLIAVFIGQHPVWMEAIAPYSTSIIAIASTWLGLQLFHRNDPKAIANSKG